jgi:acyl-CoA synthetase (AMP-forming)/AMP-acid ligase II
MDTVWPATGAASIDSASVQRRDLARDIVLGGGGSTSENLAATVWRVAAARREHPAILSSGKPITYGWIRNAAARIRDYLLRRPDFRPGALVVLALENSPEYVAAFYGVLLADGVVVPVSPRVERERWQRIYESCEPTVVLSRKADLPAEMFRSTDCRSLLPRDGEDVHEEPDGDDAPGAGVARGGRDLAVVMFTSGSTGAPKGVMLSHRNLLSNTRSILGYLPITADDRALMVLPFYHAFGNSVLQTHLLAGATLVLNSSLAIPATVVQALREHRITSLSGVPEVFTLLLRYATWDRGEMPDLRYMAVAGGALRPDLAEQMARTIAPAEFYVMYGQSEATARLSFLPPDVRQARCGSIGKAIPGVGLRVVDQQGASVRPGQVGMLQARGDNIMLGYWRDPEGTASVLSDGWLSCGDLATVDEDGFIYLRGRASHLVKLQGHRVHPAEIEDFVAARFPGSQAVVLPYVADEFTRLALFLAPSPGVQWSARDVRQACVRELPHYKIPHRIEILDCLPLNGALKVDRGELSRRLGSSPDRRENGS